MAIFTGNSNNFSADTYTFTAPTLKIVAIGDLNGDSVPDIIGHDIGADQSLQSLRFAFSSSGGTYTLPQSVDGVSAKFITPKVLVGDFSGDKTADMVVYDAGYYDWSARSTVGREPVLFIGNGSGGFSASNALTDALKPLVQPVPANGDKRGIQTDLTMGVKDIAAGDIDGDGDLDLWVESTGGNNISSHFMVNNNGSFAVDHNNRLPEEALFGPKNADGNYWRYNHAEFHDINGDGKADLLVGQIRDNDRTHINQSSFVMLNDGKGYFPSANAVRLPLPDFYSGYTAVQASDSWDINGDGRKDLVLLHTRNDDVTGTVVEPAWTGTYIQVLIQSPDGQFTDQSSQLLGDQSTWSSKNLQQGQNATAIAHHDVNLDGITDFILSYDNSARPDITRPVIFTGKPDGSFSPIDATAITGGDSFFGESILPIDLKNDVLLDFIHLDPSPGADGAYATAPGGDDQSVLIVQKGASPIGQTVAAPGSGKDTLYGTTGNDTIDALAGDDRLIGSAGNDTVDGGSGTDTAIFIGTRSAYTITAGASGVTVADSTTTRDGTDLLKNVERLVFLDSIVAFDTAGNAGQAYRLYQAAFNRTPDKGGLGYQVNALDTGFSLTQVAQNFINSPEFAATYGTLDDTQFVTQLYQNVLHRAPDADGLAFHVGNLGKGVLRAQTLVGFSESPENQAALIGVIQGGMEFLPA